MNIIYVSNLSHVSHQGPNVSVPSQVLAQTKFDTVIWINLTNARQDHWIDTGCFMDFHNKSIDEIVDFESYFSIPDLVIFEGFYYIEHVKLATLLIKKNIPYIIIPRGALTKSAQKIKRIKKKIGNLLYFRKFVKNARAIQFLTESERRNSLNFGNKTKIIIPNIFNEEMYKKSFVDKQDLLGSFIGRLDPYHKGIDLLLMACQKLKNELFDHKIKINIYGPNRKGYGDKLKKIITSKGLSTVLEIHDPVYGLDKKKILRNSDFFIMTSRFEGQPMGLIEALSYSLPVLITEGTNMGDIVQLYDAGYVSKNNVEGIVQSFTKIFESKPLFLKKGINSYNLATRYSSDIIGKLTHDEYTLLLGVKNEEN